MLPESWIPPEGIEGLRERTWLRSRWRGPASQGAAAARVSSSRTVAVREGAAAHARGSALAGALKLPEYARRQVDFLAIIGALEVQIDNVDADLGRFARPTSAARRFSRSTAPVRSSPATCLRRSAKPAASAAVPRPRAWRTRSGRSRVRRDSPARQARQGRLAAPVLALTGVAVHANGCASIVGSAHRGSCWGMSRPLCLPDSTPARSHPRAEICKAQSQPTAITATNAARDDS
jgi:hypothetical protein